MPTAAPAARRSGFLTSHFGGLPRSFWLLFSGMLVNRVGGMVLPFLVFFLSNKGITAEKAGIIVAAVGLGELIGQPVGGFLADRIGRRFTVLLGMYSTSASLMGIAAANTFLTLAAAGLLLGFTAAFARPAVSALVCDVVAPEDRARAFGLIYWSINLGAALAGVTSALLIPFGFWVLVTIDAVTCTAFAIIVHRGLLGESRPNRSDTTDSGGYGVVLKDKLAVALVLLLLANNAVHAQWNFGIPLAIRDDHLPASFFGVIYTLNGVLIAVLQPPVTTWLSRFDRMRVLAVSWITLGIGMALTGLADTPWEYVATVVVWTLGEMGAASFGTALIADLAPSGAEGRYQGAWGWAMGASRFTGPLAGGAVYATFGADSLWWGCAMIGCAGGFAGLLLTPAIRRRYSASGSS